MPDPAKHARELLLRLPAALSPLVVSQEARLGWPSLLRRSLACEQQSLLCAEESLLGVSLEEGMDRMGLEELHREHGKRARAVNPSISDLRLAVDAAAEMQVCAQCVLARI